MASLQSQDVEESEPFEGFPLLYDGVSNPHLPALLPPPVLRGSAYQEIHDADIIMIDIGLEQF